MGLLDLDTVDTVKVWDSFRSDTDIHGDHMRKLKSQDLQVVRGWKIGQKMKTNKKLLEIA